MATRKTAMGVAAVLVAAMGSALIGCGGSPARTAEATPTGGFGALDAPAPPAAQPGAPTVESAGASPSTPSAAPRDEEAKKADDGAGRPGLGTEWGESRQSRISTVPFSRADSTTPFDTAVLRYNDAQGARAMSAGTPVSSTGGTMNLGSGAVTIGLRNDSGSFFRGFVAGDADYVIGEAGSRYVIVLHNNTETRFEAVVSVDGLDVLDGRAASFKKRGYLLDPRGELEIDGFRQSTDSVAAFRFGSVRDSYAQQKHGDARNVGVIGVALFHERGSNPSRNDEVRKRMDANPFPGSFASPP